MRRRQFNDGYNRKPVKRSARPPAAVRPNSSAQTAAANGQDLKTDNPYSGRLQEKIAVGVLWKMIERL
jgi:hypothetical protein